MEAGIFSLLPAVSAVVFAFLFKEAIFSLALACIMGVLIAGNGLKGIPETIIGAIGNSSYAWLLLVFTGTSWSTFAIMLPIAIPMAFAYTSGETTTLVYATLAAVTGGSVFGDHCSPLSDTTILSSLGCACDHMDHVKTQAPYALCVGGIAAIFYVVLGLFFFFI